MSNSSIVQAISRPAECLMSAGQRVSILTRQVAYIRTIQDMDECGLCAHRIRVMRRNHGEKKFSNHARIAARETMQRRVCSSPGKVKSLKVIITAFQAGL